MAKWIDRKKAALARIRPKPTTKAQEKDLSVQATERSDNARKGEKVIVHDEIFNGAAIKNIKTKAKKQRAEAKVAEKQRIKDATDYSKEFGEESPGEGKDAKER